MTGSFITLPVTNPVLVFGLAMVIFLVAPLLAVRVRLPGIIGLIMAGAVVGPNALNILERDAVFILLGTVGLLYLVFTAGAEIDLYGFQRNRRRTIVFGSISYLIPQVVGIGVGLALGYGLAAAVLIGSMFGSHTLVAYPIAARLDIAKARAAMTAIGGTLVTDASAFLILAVVAAAASGEADGGFWLRLTAMLGGYVLLIAFGLRRLARWFFRLEVGGATVEYVFVMACVFIGAFLAQVAGVQPIVGAFLVGLALNPLIPDQGPLMNRIHFFGNALFIPFFLVSVGMLIDPAILVGSLGTWIVILAMSGTVVSTKWLAARLSQHLFGYSRAEGLTMFGLSVPQAAATLAVALVGFELGLLDDAVLNGAIIMILVTCILGPWAVEKYGRRMALQEEQRPYDPSEAKQRILVPMAKPTTADALLDLALTIRDPRAGEPIFPLTVVPPSARETEAQIAEAEGLLGHAVFYIAGADVPTRAITRIDNNPASGVLRAIDELRITTVIIGWDGSRPGRHRMFGSVLDQLLAESKQLVLVTKLGHPLKITKRLVVVIPPGSSHHPGYLEALSAVKTLAHRLGTSIQCLVVESGAADYARAFQQARPEVRLSFDEVPRWNKLLEALRDRVRPDDLIVVLSARRGTVSWHPKLDRLPGQIAELVPESFIMVYPGHRQIPRSEALVGSAARVERERYGQEL